MTLTERITEALAAWFIEQYHCDYLADCLRTGDQPDPDWEPHAGERSQAAADAERCAGVAAACLRDATPAELATALGMEQVGWFDPALAEPEYGIPDPDFRYMEDFGEPGAGHLPVYRFQKGAEQ